MLPGTSARSQRYTFLHVSFSNSFGLASVHPPHRVCRLRHAVFDNSKIKAAVPELVFNTDIEKGLEKIINHWTISEPLYDYSFEARIDRMLSKNGIKTSFIRYPGSESKSFLIYFIYKYIPYKIARRLTKWI